MMPISFDIRDLSAPPPPSQNLDFDVVAAVEEFQSVFIGERKRLTGQVDKQSRSFAHPLLRDVCDSVDVDVGAPAAFVVGATNYDITSLFLIIGSCLTSLRDPSCLVYQLDVRSVIISKKAGKLHCHAPFGALVSLSTIFAKDKKDLAMRTISRVLKAGSRE